MTIDRLSGLITWDTTGEPLGSYSVTVTVSDDHGASDSQDFVIRW